MTMKKYKGDVPTAGVTVLYFYRDACPRCKPFGEMLLTLSEAYADEPVHFLKVEAVEENFELCDKLGVDLLPQSVVHVLESYSRPTDNPVQATEQVKGALTRWNRHEEKRESDEKKTEPS